MARGAKKCGKVRKKIKKLRTAATIRQEEPPQPVWPVMTNYYQL
jgi:hypothetical protein